MKAGPFYACIGSGGITDFGDAEVLQCVKEGVNREEHGFRFLILGSPSRGVNVTEEIY